MEPDRADRAINEEERERETIIYSWSLIKKRVRLITSYYFYQERERRRARRARQGSMHFVKSFRLGSAIIIRGRRDRSVSRSIEPTLLPPVAVLHFPHPSRRFTFRSASHV